MQIDEDTKKATGITDDQIINQFPYEACLVMKHHLAETVQKVRKIQVSPVCISYVSRILFIFSIILQFMGSS